MKNTYSNPNSLRAEFSLNFMFLEKYKPQMNADERRFIIWAPAFIGFYAWLIDSNVITGILRGGLCNE
jgi:hypothetical protein